MEPTDLHAELDRLLGPCLIPTCPGADLSGVPDTVTPMQPLTVRDHMTLQLEHDWWKYAGAKEARIRELFGESATRYYQRLNALLDRPEALAEYPLVVRRLLRLREARRRARSAV